MRRISSSFTLFVKIFLPTFWIVFFSMFTIAVLASGVGKSPLFTNWIFKLGLLGFLLGGILFLYFTLFRLKRVELDHDHLYVTNYFKSVKYLLVDVDYITETSLGIAHLGHIYLKAPGVFGKRLTFLQSRQKFEDFIKADPTLSKLVMPEGPLNNNFPI